MAGSRSLAASAAVAAAVALASAALAGGPLYVSSAATADLHRQLATTCASDAGLQARDWTIGPRTPAARAAIDDLPHLGPALETRWLTGAIARPGGENVPVVVMMRTGQEAERGIRPLARFEAAVSSSDLHRLGVATGDRVSFLPSSDRFGPDTSSAELRIAETYPDIPVYPEPPLWCALRDFFRPGTFGDLPAAVVLVSADTFAAGPGWNPLKAVDWQPDPGGMTRDDAVALSSSIATGAQRLHDAVESDLSRGSSGVTASDIGIEDTSQLHTLVGRAETIATVVGRTVTPVVLTGLAAAALVLVASGLFVARRSIAELRLRGLRGTTPLALGVRVTAWVAPAGLVGAAVGIGLAIAATVTLGPSPLLEPDAVRQAIVLGLAGGAAGILLVGIAGTVVAVRAVDPPVRHHGRRPIPWELLPVGLAVLSYLRLDQLGGVQLVGASVRGGDLLAQAFPLLSVAAVLAVLVRPLGVLLRWLRGHGRRWPIGVLVGVRRWSSDAATTIATTLAVAFVVGLAVLATTSTASASQSLLDKARTFNGTDLVVRAVGGRLPIPPGLADRATIVERASARDSQGSVELIGIDPATFGRGVHWLDGAAGRSIASIGTTLAAPPPDGEDIAAITIGALDLTVRATIGREPMTIEQRDAMTWFPGLEVGTRLAITRADALAASPVGSRTEIWVRDPPADADEQLRAVGWHTVVSFEATGAFDSTGFRAMRYSFGSFSALAGLGLVVVVVGELLVIDARRRRRAAAGAIESAVGFTRRSRVTATLLELGVPFVVGAVLGVGAGLGTFALANERLDPLRALPPPARVAVGTGGIVVVGVAVVVIAAGLVLVALAAGRRTDAMEAMRGG